MDENNKTKIEAFKLTKERNEELSNQLKNINKKWEDMTKN